METNLLDNIILKYQNPSGKVLSILEEVQEKQGYLSRESLIYISKNIKVPLTQIYSIATFYSFFNLKPVGTNIISVCMGTACHVKGAAEILNNLEYLLDVKEDEITSDGKFLLTTQDKNFSLNVARCFGCCSMAPVVRINEKIYGHMTINTLPKILKEYGWIKK
jgi:NADH-quinone oxidoreductase subunit E